MGTWQEYLFCAKLRCASTFCLPNWASFVNCFKNGRKSTEPWCLYYSVNLGKNKVRLFTVGMVHFILLWQYSHFSFSSSVCIYFLELKKLLNVLQDTGFFQFSCHWNGCTVCTRESLKKTHQLLVFKCNCSWEMRSRNGD